MSMDYVRRTYGVPAKRGLRVTVDGRPGVITRATHYVYVRFDDVGFSRPCHPTWRIDYAPADPARAVPPTEGG
jgi:hypothetical protein